VPPDRLLVFDAPDRSAKLAICTAAELSRDAAARHALAEGSAAALGQAFAGTLLLTAADPDAPRDARIDVQLECTGPLKGLFTDADAGGAVRGLVRVSSLDREGAPAIAQAFTGTVARFDPRPVFASGFDEQAGFLSVLRAQPGSDALHRAAFPFAGADLGAALTLYLRSDREGGGEMALEVLLGEDGDLAAVAGALVWSEDEEDDLRALGKPLRQSVLRGALASEPDDAERLAAAIAAELHLGPVSLDTEVRPRFACRCSRERVVRALRTLGRAELLDMAEKDGGAEATCDFCARSYRLSRDELLELAAGPV
jgi:molecular chaperone Hsp33